MNPPDYVLDVFLQPGDFYFGDSETRIRTLLGSCIAITIWHPHYLMGGMCHYLLPEFRPLNSDGNNDQDARYADQALNLFMVEVRQSGTHPSEYRVKMFGGGNQFSGQNLKGKQSVPEKNIDFGKKLLAQHGFNLSSCHLGGNGHRKVIFDIWSGDVWVQHVNG